MKMSVLALRDALEDGQEVSRIPIVSGTGATIVIDARESSLVQYLLGQEQEPQEDQELAQDQELQEDALQDDTDEESATVNQASQPSQLVVPIGAHPLQPSKRYPSEPTRVYKINQTSQHKWTK